MYEHALATLSLIEAYGGIGSLPMRRSLQKGVDLIVASQNGEGGWRYQPRAADADLSVTVMQIVALRAAINARLNVPQATTDKATNYVKSCIAPAGGFSYQPHGGANCAQSAAGALSLQLLGQFDDPAVRKALELLQGKNYNGHMDPYFWYMSYYAMQAHFQAGEAQWATWHPRVRKFLLDTQNEDGSWPGHGEDKFNGPALTYSTALGACPGSLHALSAGLSAVSDAGRAGRPGPIMPAQPPSRRPVVALRTICNLGLHKRIDEAPCD